MDERRRAELRAALDYGRRVADARAPKASHAMSGEHERGIEAAMGLVNRIEEAAADGRLPAMLNMGPLTWQHPLYDVWAAMEAVKREQGRTRERTELVEKDEIALWLMGDPAVSDEVVTNFARRFGGSRAS
jgi:hypothetical protein